jgi:hypothetical protein
LITAKKRFNEGKKPFYLGFAEKVFPWRQGIGNRERGTVSRVG